MEIVELAQLGGTVFTTALFIWYLRDKNGKSERAMKGVTDNLEKMATHQETHTRVLMRITQQHGLNDESNELMTGRK
jgi:hypothetical protein